MEAGDVDKFEGPESTMKSVLIELVADQTGKLLDPTVLTIVWARRFCELQASRFIEPEICTDLML